MGHQHVLQHHLRGAWGRGKDFRRTFEIEIQVKFGPVFFLFTQYRWTFKWCRRSQELWQRVNDLRRHLKTYLLDADTDFNDLIKNGTCSLLPVVETCDNFEVLYFTHLNRLRDCLRITERMKQVDIICAAQSAVILWMETGDCSVSLRREWLLLEICGMTANYM